MTNDQGIISRAITWLFGANYKTSMSGYITIVAYLIHDKPQIIQWIPEPAKGVIWNVSEYIFLGAALAFAKQVKDKNVTGGSTAQTLSGATAVAGSQLVDITTETSKLSGEAVSPPKP